MLDLLSALPPIYRIAIMLSFLVSLGLILSQLRKTKDSYFLYKKRQSVMTTREQEFFRKLEAEYGQQNYVFPQINLDKLVEVDPNIRDYSYRNKIDRKSVDYVIVDKISLRTIKLIELDDSTHLNTSRIKRDAFVNEILLKCEYDLERVNH